MSSPTFAAIIPTYNRANSVAEAVESVLDQHLAPEEVIVVDDGSTDDTATVLERFGERITVISQPNAGVAAARNAGAAVARSDWLTFCDSDDVWVPGRMELLRSDLAQAQPEIVAHVGNVLFTGHGPDRHWFEFTKTGVSQGEVRIERQPLGVFLHCFSPIAAALRRDIFFGLGGFDVSFPADEDSELGHRFADLGYFIIRGDVMAEARRQPGDDIALSVWRGKNPAEAVKLKEEQFRRILARSNSQANRDLASAALSSCLRDQADLVSQGKMEGSRTALLSQSVRAHHSLAKGLVLAVLSFIGLKRDSAALDRT